MNRQAAGAVSRIVSKFATLVLMSTPRTQIIGCPKCGAFHQWVPDEASTPMVCTRMWTDGLPDPWVPDDVPALVECEACGALFWADEAPEVGSMTTYEGYVREGELSRWEILSAGDDRLTTMRALRRHFGLSLQETKAALDHLPYQYKDYPSMESRCSLEAELRRIGVEYRVEITRSECSPFPEDGAPMSWRCAPGVQERLGEQAHLKCIQLGMASQRNCELTMRIRAWWAASQPMRRDVTAKPAECYAAPDTAANLQALKALLNPAELNQRCMLAELARHQREFRRCLDLVSGLQTPWAKEISERAELEDDWVRRFELPENELPV